MNAVSHDWVRDWLTSMMLLLPLYWFVDLTLHLLFRPLRARNMWLVFVESIVVSLLLSMLLIDFRLLAPSLASFGAGAFLARLGVAVVVELAVHRGDGPAVLKQAGYHALRAAAAAGTALMVFSDFRTAMASAIFAIPLTIIMACDFACWVLCPRSLRGSFVAIPLESTIAIVLCLGFWFTVGSRASQMVFVIMAFLLRLAVAVVGQYLRFRQHRPLGWPDGIFALGRGLVCAFATAAILELA
ncbi:hypothetical protein [Dongia sp.]|uniref:hypothetical protein n=1 Tax=Dongia sp. TaxID=1977262 RepID=UPI0035B37FFB